MQNRNKIISMVGYLIFLVPFLVKEKNDEKVRFHARQALGLFVVFVSLIGLMTMIGAFISLSSLLTVTIPRVIFLVGAIVGMMNVYADRRRPLPYIGEYIIKIFA